MSFADRLRKLPILAWVWIVIVVLLLVGSFDWRAKTDATPHTDQAFRTHGTLRAGAAKADITPPFPSPLGGYNTRGNDRFESVLHPTLARALVVEVGGKSLGFVSLEVVVLPAPLRQKVVEKTRALGLSDVVISATHTHSGPGAYWDKQLAEWVGLGTYDPKVEAVLVDGMAKALTEAHAALRPAKVSWARLASNYAVNRARPNAKVDQTLTGLRIDGDDGTALARLIVYASHPTIMPRDLLVISGDWPGALMRTMEADTGAVVLFAQGAGGDATWNKREGGLTQLQRVVQFGEAFAADARGAIAAAGGNGERECELAFSRVSFALPPGWMEAIVWGPFEPLANNVAEWLVRPGTTSVSMLQLGPARFAFVPAEPVADLGMAWKERTGGASIVGLTDDYVGYVETAERAEQEMGESFRQYFTPELDTRLDAALQQAAKDVGPPPAPSDATPAEEQKAE